MKVDTYQCDGCGKQKQGANHWFKGYLFADKQGIAIVPWAATSVYVAAGGTIETTLDNADAHLCGADCVTQWQSKNLLS